MKLAFLAPVVAHPRIPPCYFIFRFCRPLLQLSVPLSHNLVSAENNDFEIYKTNCSLETKIIQAKPGNSTGCRYICRVARKSALIPLEVNLNFDWAPNFPWDVIRRAILSTAIADLYAKQFPIMTAVSWLLHYLRARLSTLPRLNGNFTIHYFCRNREAARRPLCTTNFPKPTKKYFTVRARRHKLSWSCPKRYLLIYTLGVV